MIAKPVSRLVQEFDAKSFTVIGAPSADGLGTTPMQRFHAALAGAEGDFVVVLGDVSPLGHDPYYRNVARFIDDTSPRPVYVVKGARDGDDFGDYFGFDNSAIISEDFVLVMLDNSGRRFSDVTLKFLQETMAIVDSRNVIVAFHIPPPNRISGDSMTAKEWSRFEEAVGVWRNRITLLVCGHSCNYYEDDIEGLPLVVTGGGGASIRKIERVVSPPHHALEIDMDAGGMPRVRKRFITPDTGENREPEIGDSLGGIYDAQCRAHVSHLLAAEDAEKSARPQLARLYKAVAKSNFRQARLVYRLMRRGQNPAAMAERDLRDFEALGEDARRDRVAAAEMAHDVLAANLLRGSGDADRVSAALMEKALSELGNGWDIPTVCYYVCQLCGMIFTGTEPPSYCSECGAPTNYLRESE